MNSESNKPTLLSQFKFKSQLVVSNPRFESTNWKTRHENNFVALKSDATHLPPEHDTLVISFNLDVFSGIHNPEFSGDDAILKCYKEAVLNFICEYGYFSGFDTLDEEISQNIAEANFIDEFLDEFSDVDIHMKRIFDNQETPFSDDKSEICFLLGKSQYFNLGADIELTLAGFNWRDVYQFGKKLTDEYAKANVKIITYVHIGKGKRLYISDFQTEKAKIDHITDSLYTLRPKCFDGFQPEKKLIIKPLNFYRNDEKFCKLFKRFVYGEPNENKSPSVLDLYGLAALFESGYVPQFVTCPIYEKIEFLMAVLVRGDDDD